MATDGQWDDLVRVHHMVKDRFNYTPDMKLYNTREFWAVMKADYRGDCEDFALTCRKILLSKGWSRKDLRPACCWTETGGYHAVVVAEIEGDGYVMDNRQNRVLAWRDLPYTWDKILDRSGLFWVAINS